MNFFTLASLTKQFYKLAYIIEINQKMLENVINHISETILKNKDDILKKNPPKGYANTIFYNVYNLNRFKKTNIKTDIASFNLNICSVPEPKSWGNTNENDIYIYLSLNSLKKLDHNIIMKYIEHVLRHEITHLLQIKNNQIPNSQLSSDLASGTKEEKIALHQNIFYEIESLLGEIEQQLIISIKNGDVSKLINDLYQKISKHDFIIKILNETYLSEKWFYDSIIPNFPREKFIQLLKDKNISLKQYKLKKDNYRYFLKFTYEFLNKYSDKILNKFIEDYESGKLNKSDKLNELVFKLKEEQNSLPNIFDVITGEY